MELRARRRGRLAVASAGVAVLALLTATACTARPSAPAPPVVAVGDAIVGPNPQTEGTPGATTTVVTYGPWTVPGARGPGHDQAGMVENVRFGVSRPCTDCYITGARPQLRYRDGRVANTDTGLWLHHFALLNSGARDARCGTVPLVNLVGEVLFTGANERTQGRFPPHAGYRVRPFEVWTLLVDLMNTGPDPQEVVFEMEFDWVPASTPGMHHARPVFLDVGEACVNSTVPAGTGQYRRSSTWEVTVPGRILGLASHTHDGGVRVTLRNQTTGELICDSKAYYGGPGFEEPAPAGGEADGHGHGATGHGTVHLSAVDQCVAPSIDRPVAVIERGQILELEAFYDADAHPHPLNEPVMGLVFMYVLPA